MDDLFDISGKAAVVTGGGRGIGEMIASGLVDRGVKVYISSRKAGPLQEAADRMSAGGTCIAVPADLSTGEGVATLAEAVADEPKIDILVNNSGVTWGAPLDEFPKSGFDKVLDTNVTGVFLVTQALLPKLRAAATPEDPARVINIGSVAGNHPPGRGGNNWSYSASKAAVHMLTKHLAMDLAREHITVNAIAPGPFPSKMMAFLLDDPDTREVVASSVPLGRIGRPSDAAGTVIYLSSAAGSYLTGAVIPLGGGSGI